METTGRHNRPMCLLAVLAVLLIALPPLTRHALERHGRSATSAHYYMARHDPSGRRPDNDGDQDDETYWTGTQDDGRTVHILRLPQLPNTPTTWAIVVVGAGCCVTAFLSQSRRRVERIKERIRPTR